MALLDDGVELTDCFPISEVPFKIPPMRGGKRVATATIYRWVNRGLRTILLGGTRATCDHWLREFFESQTAARDHRPDTAAQIPAKQRTSRRTDVEKELDKLLGA